MVRRLDGVRQIVQYLRARFGVTPFPLSLRRVDGGQDGGHLGCIRLCNTTDFGEGGRVGDGP